jgi:hypothetical protein
LLPRLEILPSKVRSPVDCCLGTRPSQAAKSRPCLKALPEPMAATTALEMIGPIPGTVIKALAGRIILAEAQDFGGQGFVELGDESY